MTSGRAVIARSRIPLRPALVGLAGLTVIVGLFAFVRAFPNVWAVDAHRNLAAASAALNGSFGTVPDYLYSPLAAVLTIPALRVPPDVAVAGWLVVKVALLLVGTAIATRGLETADRVLVGTAVVFFLPILYDIELGNVTVFVLAAVVLVAWTPDRFITGIPLGLLLATAPKPQLIPVLLWMVLANRKALAGAAVMATSVTLAAIVAIGTPAYATWVATLRAPSYMNAGEVINLAIWPQPMIVAAVGSVAAVLAFGVALRRGYWPGLLAAICLGLLLAPYSLIYGAALLPAVAPATGRAAPGALMLLALTAPVALVLVFPAWVAIVLALAALVPAVAWPGRETPPGLRDGDPEPVD